MVPIPKELQLSCLPQAASTDPWWGHALVERGQRKAGEGLLAEGTLKCNTGPPHPTPDRELGHTKGEGNPGFDKNQPSPSVCVCLASLSAHGEYFGVGSHSWLAVPAVWVTTTQQSKTPSL